MDTGSDPPIEGTIFNGDASLCQARKRHIGRIIQKRTQERDFCPVFITMYGILPLADRYKYNKDKAIIGRPFQNSTPAMLVYKKDTHGCKEETKPKKKPDLWYRKISTVRSGYNQSHAAQLSSSPSSFGFVSICFAGAAAFGFAASAFAIRAVVFFVDADLVKPLGSGFFALALDCAASQPAKSGSPPSSNGTVVRAGDRAGLGVPWDLAAVSKKASPFSFCPWSSSSMAPHVS